MIVRCGGCKTELEVAGPGEFSCPACGTRNSVRAPGGTPNSAPANPFGLPDLGGSAPSSDPVDLVWIRCVDCRRKFVVGETLETVPCPACGREHEVATAERA